VRAFEEQYAYTGLGFYGQHPLFLHGKLSPIARCKQLVNIAQAYAGGVMYFGG